MPDTPATSGVVEASGPRKTRNWPIARIVLGVLLAAMAAGQLSDPGGFVDILRDYRMIPPALVPAFAGALMALEAAAAVLLFRGRRAGGSLALTVAVVWSVLAVTAFARGLALTNCGCFGVHLGQSLRWWVLVEDAEFLALAWWVRRRSAGP